MTYVRGGKHIMPFVNYKSLASICGSDSMKKNVRSLKEYDEFHCLLTGSKERMNAVASRVADLPKDYLAWLSVCDGGMLFDTSMLTTKTKDSELNLSFETYGDYCDAELRKDKRIADGWFVFAVAVHSDVFFFDMNKKDGKVYQWDVEERKIYATWSTFGEWLTAQISEAAELIAKEQLEPLGIKTEAR
jgi:hypothetical protein